MIFIPSSVTIHHVVQTLQDILSSPQNNESRLKKDLTLNTYHLTENHNSEIWAACHLNAFIRSVLWFCPANPRGLLTEKINFQICSFHGKSPFLVYILTSAFRKICLALHFFAFFIFTYCVCVLSTDCTIYYNHIFISTARMS